MTNTIKPLTQIQKKYLKERVDDIVNSFNRQMERACRDITPTDIEGNKTLFKALTAGLKQSPTISCCAHGEEIFLAVKENFNQVTLNFSDACIGKRLLIMNSAMQMIDEHTQLINDSEIILSLKTGFYGYVVEGTELTGGINVSQNLVQYVG
jgi:hypothetical protein